MGYIHPVSRRMEPMPARSLWLYDVARGTWMRLMFGVAHQRRNVLPRIRNRDFPFSFQFYIVKVQLIASTTLRRQR